MLSRRCAVRGTGAGAWRRRRRRVSAAAAGVVLGSEAAFFSISLVFPCLIDCFASVCCTTTTL
jgi:hypothetical protein